MGCQNSGLKQCWHCADRNTCVQVAATVDRIADNSIPRVGVLVEDDRLFHLFRYKHAHTARRLHGGDEDVIANDVQLLLVVTSGVGRASKTAQVDQGSSPDVVCDRLERELEGMAQQREVTSRFLVLALLLSQPPREGDGVRVDLLLTSRASVVGAA